MRVGYGACAYSRRRSWLTIKSHSNRAGLSRYEFEKEISNDEAQHLFELCRGGVIDKRRWLVKSPDGQHTFEVDEFYGDNAGLVVAEVELSSEDEPFGKPDFIGEEVTATAATTTHNSSSIPIAVGGRSRAIYIKYRSKKNDEILKSRHYFYNKLILL